MMRPDDPFARMTGAAANGGDVLQWPADARVAECMRGWLNEATRADHPDTRLFAKLIAERDARNELALLGLPLPEWRALLARHFGRATKSALPQSLPLSLEERARFIRALHALLLAHASGTVHADDARCLATIIAHACLRPDHLWRDLGLAGRDEVTWMLTRYFPSLVALNVENLRWKKFLAAQCALSLGLQPGPAPGCPGCEDYGYCFPPRR